MAGGRPSKYESHVQPKLLLIEAWARNGITDKDISEKLGVSHDSFIEYKKQYPELVESLKKGKEVIDTMVENALLKAALGYDFEEEALDKMGDIHSLKKFAHPNTTALIFWLKNRNPKDWRDKQDIEHSGNVEYVVKLPSPPA
jgi:hypothetical protein